MNKHPQAAILERVIKGEDLKGRLWCFAASRWCKASLNWLADAPNEIYAVSDKPNIPPPLPRKKLTLREGGPWYYQGETVAPVGDAHVWIARPGALEAVNKGGFGAYALREECLRLGLVHLSEENYRLHMAAQEDLLMWAHAGGVK